MKYIIFSSRLGKVLKLWLEKLLEKKVSGNLRAPCHNFSSLNLVKLKIMGKTIIRKRKYAAESRGFDHNFPSNPKNYGSVGPAIAIIYFVAFSVSFLCSELFILQTAHREDSGLLRPLLPVRVYATVPCENTNSPMLRR